ncbi:MAG: 3-isopropylmalate dehydratase/homoaconitate hydratase family large subunit [Dehalobacterium sp.]
MNEVERYLAKAAGKDRVKPGDDITVKVDLVISHDVTGPMAADEFEKIGIDRVFDDKKVVFVFDHIMPAATVDAKALHHRVKNFSRRYHTVLYDKGQGVIHQVVAERHPLDRGAVVIGADSHTCMAGAYGAIAIGVGASELAATMATGTIDIEVPEVYEIKLEGDFNPGVYAKDLILYLIGKYGTDGFTDKCVVYSGSAVTKMSVEEKMTISNMGIEMGAMISYFSNREDVGPVLDTQTFNLGEIVPSLACPPSPGNVVPVEQAAGTPITQVVIGSCTNGRMSDMKIAAEVLNGLKVHDDVTLIVVPASDKILEEMDDQGITKVLRQAGALVTNPGCGPCFGAHLGLLTKDDVAVSTTNRNFPGRMGHREAKVYLASPRTAAESAVAGKVVVPGTVKPLEGGGW